MAQLFSLGRMNTTLLKNWAGLVSIVWMVGAFVLLNHAPENFILFKFDATSWLTQFSYLGIWLGIGLILAVTGLRCRALAGRVCAVIAICIFVYFAWDLLYPSQVPGMKVMRPNKSPEPTAVGAVRSAIAVHVVSRRWLSFLR